MIIHIAPDAVIGCPYDDLGVRWFWRTAWSGSSQPRLRLLMLKNSSRLNSFIPCFR